MREEEIYALVEEMLAGVFGEILGRPVCASGLGEALSRKHFDELTGFVKLFGAKGLAWVKVETAGWGGPIAKFFSAEQQAAFNERCGSIPGDVLLFLADRGQVVCGGSAGCGWSSPGASTSSRAASSTSSGSRTFRSSSTNEEEKRLDAKHHPFTAPADEDLALLETEPLAVRAKAYDIVLNGQEIGGECLRIFQPDVQRRMFRALNIADEEAEAKFGFLLEAFQHGAPPTAASPSASTGCSPSSPGRTPSAR